MRYSGPNAARFSSLALRSKNQSTALVSILGSASAKRLVRDSNTVESGISSRLKKDASCDLKPISRSSISTTFLSLA